MIQTHILKGQNRGCQEAVDSMFPQTPATSTILLRRGRLS
jgi:hypothetical protein